MEDLMEEVEQLIDAVLAYGPIPRLSYRELFQEYLDFDPHTISLQSLQGITALRVKRGRRRRVSGSSEAMVLKWWYCDRQISVASHTFSGFGVTKRPDASATSGNARASTKTSIEVSSTYQPIVIPTIISVVEAM